MVWPLKADRARGVSDRSGVPTCAPSCSASDVGIHEGLIGNGSVTVRRDSQLRAGGTTGTSMARMIGHTRSQHLRIVGGLLGTAIMSLAFIVLTTWEVHLFRATFGKDFTGAVCGTPLDNPGWTVGSPCHGAVNRQLAGTVALMAVGVTLIARSVKSGLANRDRATEERRGTHMRFESRGL